MKKKKKIEQDDLKVEELLVPISRTSGLSAVSGISGASGLSLVSENEVAKEDDDVKIVLTNDEIDPEDEEEKDPKKTLSLKWKNW